MPNCVLDILWSLTECLYVPLANCIHGFNQNNMQILSLPVPPRCLGLGCFAVLVGELSNPIEPS